jgi:hypothetical protein
MNCINRKNISAAGFLILISIFVALSVRSGFTARHITVKKISTEAVSINEDRKRQIVEELGKLPLRFEENFGQVSSKVRFISRGKGYQLFLTPEETVFVLGRLAKTSVVKMKLIGANREPRITGTDKISGRTNYLVGKNTENWKLNIPNYSRVKYEQVYPGIDVVYYGTEGNLEYDFQVSPGANAKLIRLNFEGSRNLNITEAGDLIINTEYGAVYQKKAHVYQFINGQKHEVACRYVLMAKGRVGFELGSYDSSSPLIIDPVLSYSTYLGGSSSDIGHSIAVDSSGNAYVAGETQSTNFPTSSAYQGSLSGSTDLFVTKLNSSGGGFVYSTYIGGTGTDVAYGLTTDSSNNVYLTGYTESTNFPTSNAYQGTHGGGTADAFITKLNSSGNALTFSTFIGGSGSDQGRSIKLDSSNNAYITGHTASTNFPTSNAYQTSNGGSADVFISKIDSTGSVLSYSTYLGGSGNDYGRAIAVDSTGYAYITGYTQSSNYPTSNAYQSSSGGSDDVFVSKLDLLGSLSYSTYLGGSGIDSANAIHVDGSGNAFITGETRSTNFPTVGAYQSSSGGGTSDVFVSKISSSGSGLSYSTYLGGSNTDLGRGIALDSYGNLTVTGETQSTNFPVEKAIQSTSGGSIDAFVTKIKSSGNGLIYSTYLGGTSSEKGHAIIIDSSDKAYVTGYTQSTNFPTASALQTSSGGSDDAFVLKISGVNYTISGRITEGSGAGRSGVTVNLSGSQTSSTQTDSTGNYSFANLPEAGDYTVSPTGGIFAPTSSSFNNLSANQTANFTMTVTYTVSGSVKDASNNIIDGVTFTLSGSSTELYGNGSDGNYSITPLNSGGNYTITPSKTGYTFSPTSQTYNNLGANQTLNFTATRSYEITGRIISTTDTAISGVTVTLSGSQTGSATTDDQGLYTIPSVGLGGTYTVTPSKTGYSFGPASQTVSSMAGDQVMNFVGQEVRTITGRVKDASNVGISDATVTLSGSQSISVLTNSNGDYSITTIKSGNYTVTPSKAGYSFNPVNRTYSNLSSDQTGADFTAKVTPYQLTLSLSGQDIGAVGVTGSTSSNNGIYTVNGSGADLSGSSDAFHYANQQITGDTVIISRVSAVQNTNSGAKAGLMIREGLTAGSKHVGLFLSPSGDVSFLRRTSTSGATSTTAGGTKAVPYWLMLIRKGSEIAGYSSIDGQNWVLVDAVTITLNSTVYAGLAVTSKNNTVLNTSTFDNVSLWGGTPNHPPQISISKPANGTSHNSGSNVVIETTTSDKDGFFVISKVEFYANGNLIATDTSEPYTYTWTSPAAGTYAITARAIDNENASTFSSPISVLVNQTGITTLNPTADTYVRDGFVAGSNFGTSSSLDVSASATTNENRHGYLKFDLSSIPSTFASAKLRVYGKLSSTGSQTIGAYPVTDTTWIESGTGSMTWNNKPAMGTQLSTATYTSTSYGFYDLDVTTYLQAEKTAGRNTVSLGLQCTSNSSIFFLNNSREASIGKPELRIIATTAPSISSLTPNSGPINTSVTIAGTNFGTSQSSSSISFNGTSAAAVSWSDTSIQVSVPVGTTTGAVVVTVNGQASNQVTYTVSGTLSDSDGDGLPDSWENTYFGNLNENGGGDPDGDGKNNLSEYLQGRNPTKSTITDTNGAVNLKVHTPLDK